MCTSSLFPSIIFLIFPVLSSLKQFNFTTSVFPSPLQRPKQQFSKTLTVSLTSLQSGFMDSTVHYLHQKKKIIFLNSISCPNITFNRYWINFCWDFLGGGDHLDGGGSIDISTGLPLSNSLSGESSRGTRFGTGIVNACCLQSDVRIPLFSNTHHL